MKLFLILVPVLLFGATREQCAQMVKDFEPLEKSYDAVVASGVASPVCEKIIRDFRREGGTIYTECKDKMDTTPWYMLGKKIKPYGVDIEKFHLDSPADLTRYALSHPPVVTEYRCGTVTQGIHLPVMESR
jgi:hypothetical protein